MDTNQNKEDVLILSNIKSIKEIVARQEQELKDLCTPPEGAEVLIDRPIKLTPLQQRILDRRRKEFWQDGEAD